MNLNKLMLDLIYVVKKENPEILNSQITTVGFALIKLLNNQPDQNKEEDSYQVRCLETESNAYFSVAQVSGTNDWIKMRCSEHCGNTVREVQND